MRAAPISFGEDDKVGTSQLQKGQITRKRRQGVFEKWYSYEKDGRILGAADDTCISRVYM